VARQGVEVVSLPLKGIGVVTHTSREVGDTLEYLTGPQQARSERLKIRTPENGGGSQSLARSRGH
jgi:hypothetical protein